MRPFFKPADRRVRRPKSRCLSILAAVCLSSGSLYALQLRAYDSDRHQRFVSGYPDDPAVNTNWMGIPYDFSGVGWDDSNSSRSITLISPKHFVGANHYRIPVGHSVSFLNRMGETRSYTMAAYHSITNSDGEATDLYVGELETAVSPCDHIAWYPVADLLSEAMYSGETLYVYGKTTRLGNSTVGAFLTFGEDPITGGSPIHSTRMYTFSYSSVGGDADDCYAETGDSGSPSFIIISNHLYLTGVHSAILSAVTGTETFDTFVPHYLDQLDAILQADHCSVATSIDETFYPCIQLSFSDSDDVIVGWGTYAGRDYQLQFGQDLISGFTNLSPVIAAESSWLSYTNTGAGQAEHRYYRVLKYP